MESGNDPANVAYVVQENGFWYVAYKEKVKVPNIIVSAKGVANGLSEEYNDGWDFGPDSYNPSITSGVPLTQTCGIQEAISYAVVNGVKIKLSAGVFNVTAPFVEFDTTNSRYGLINVMPITATQVIAVDIEGVGSFASGGSSETVNTNNITVINILTPAMAGTSVYQQVFYVSTPNDGYTFPIFKNIALIQPAPCNIGGYFDAHTALANSIADGLWTGPTNADMNFFSGVASTNTHATAYNFNGQEGNVCKIGVITAQQMYSAFGGNLAHVSILQLVVQSCIHGIDMTANMPYGMSISEFDVQGTTYPIYQTSILNGSLFIGTWFEEDYTGVSGITPAFETLYEIYATGGHLSIFIGQVQIHRNTNTIIASLQVTGTLANLAVGVLTNQNSTVASQSAKTYLSPAIPTNPPVSGTVYQNTNLYDIEIDLPVYATTAGTAGYVTLAKGSTSTPAAIGNQYVNGATSSTSVDILRLRVPAGWYFSFTASGVTIGTAVPFAE